VHTVNCADVDETTDVDGVCADVDTATPPPHATAVSDASETSWHVEPSAALHGSHDVNAPPAVAESQAAVSEKIATI